MLFEAHFGEGGQLHRGHDPGGPPVHLVGLDRGPAPLVAAVAVPHHSTADEQDPVAQLEEKGSRPRNPLDGAPSSWGW